MQGVCAAIVPLFGPRVAKQRENNAQLPLDPRTGTFHFKGRLMTRMKAHSGEKPNNDVLGWEDILMLDDDANAEVEFTKGLMAGAFFSG